MRVIWSIFICFFSFTVSGQLTFRQYQDLTKKFIVDAVHDSTHYGLKDFLMDSILYASNGQNTEGLKWLIDTCEDAYAIRTVNLRIKLNRLIIQSEPEYSRVLSYTLYDGRDSDSFNLYMDSLNKDFYPGSFDIVKSYGLIWDSSFLEATFIPRIRIDSIFNDIHKGWNYFGKSYGSPLLVLGMPIFNKTEDLAYFEWSYFCGSLCAEGFAALYKKVNGNWIAQKVRKRWSS